MKIRLPIWNVRGRSSSNVESTPDVDSTPDVTDGLLPLTEEQPKSEPLTFEENLEKFCVYEASKLLIEREDCLFGKMSETETSEHHQEEMDKIFEDYRKLEERVRYILEGSICVGLEDVSMENLRSAVKAICQEEERYQVWTQKNQTPPIWRQSSWKEFHDSLLLDLIRERLEALPTTHPEMNEFLHKEVSHMGKQLKEDLIWVVEVVKLCYPPHMDICNSYARMYHRVFSKKVKMISELILVDKDVTFLLRWANEFYPGILQKPELTAEIDTDALGKLLSQKDLELLEKQYLSKQQNELTTYISRVLEEVEQRWKDEEDPQREDGCYVSPVAYDIIQFINGMVTSSETVVGDRHKAQSITCNLSSLMERFKNFQSNIIKKNKANSRAYVKANLGCIEQFRDVLENNGYLFTEDERQKCLCIVAEMKQSAHTYLLSPIHDSLKSQYRKLGTNDWLKKSAFEKLLENIETKMQDLQGLTTSCHQELIGQFHHEVAVKYLSRLLRGEVKLKNQEQQEEAYMVVKDNAETLHKFFSRMGSKDERLKDVLTKIAEVLKLQELPAIQIHVATLGSCFPDISERHVSALLKLKTNVSKADRKTVKDTLSDILKESQMDNAPPFFSQVHVK